MITEEQAQERVDKGMAWLQEVGGVLDFHIDNINPDTISIVSETCCVLAQAAGTHYALAGMRIAGTLRMTLTQTTAWAIEHGFNVQYNPACTAASPVQCTNCYNEAVEDGELLTDAWRTAIRQHQLLVSA